MCALVSAWGCAHPPLTLQLSNVRDGVRRKGGLSAPRFSRRLADQHRVAAGRAALSGDLIAVADDVAQGDDLHLAPVGAEQFGAECAMRNVVGRCGAGGLHGGRDLHRHAVGADLHHGGEQSLQPRPVGAVGASAVGAELLHGLGGELGGLRADLLSECGEHKSKTTAFR